MTWLVAYQSRNLASAYWQDHVRWYPSRALAEKAFQELLPGEGGSFGPIEFRNVTLAKIHRQVVEA